MAIINKITGFALADSTGFSKLERDALILPGTKSMFDFANPYVNEGRDQLVAGNVFKNLARNGQTATVGTPAAFGYNAGLLAAKGLVQNISDGHVLLGSNFNFLNLAASTDFILQVWLTRGATLESGSNIIAGNAYALNEFCQWTINQESGGANFRVRVGGPTGNATVIAMTPPTGGVPVLVSIVGRHTSGTAYDIEVYQNATSIGTGSISSFNNPASSPTPTEVPRIGLTSGYGTRWIGTVHRAHIATLPDAYDVPAYLANDVALNYSRFVAA